VSFYPEEKRLLIEKALERLFPSEATYPEIIYKAMRYSLFSGGKRFRPVLTISTVETLGKSVDFVLPTACAIEYIHTYSLIHDDLPAIDNDDYRRGRLTCHKVFGEGIALMAGNALFAEAFKLISELQRACQSDKIVEVIREISQASGASGMVGGQVVDMISTGKKVSFETLEYIHSHKTGRLIEAAVRSAATLADVSPAELGTLTKYAQELGLAFQITDDILDEVGELKELGKVPGGDRHRKKVTFPSFFGLEEARRRAGQRIEQAKQALDKIDRDTNQLKNLAEFVIERTK
jgi:geranylgeranyl diphosphate synthase type II